jgi:hypothetical protein
MGDNPPADYANWPPERAYESLMRLLPKYQVEGAYWHWVGYTNSDDSDPTLAGVPIKVRGVDFKYNPVEKILFDRGGWHASGIQNGSFESGSDHWTAGGSGTVAPYDLTQDAGEPEVPWRGTHALRLTTASGASDTVTATSDRFAVLPGIVYTATAAVRFSFADDKPTAAITLLYYQADGTASHLRAADSFTYHRVEAPTGFGTFPVQYVPPPDAASAAVQFSVARAGSSLPATIDVDDFR